jgi:hypothetical protein
VSESRLPFATRRSTDGPRTVFELIRGPVAWPGEKGEGNLGYDLLTGGRQKVAREAWYERYRHDIGAAAAGRRQKPRNVGRTALIIVKRATA